MAKTELENLVVQLSADVKGYENALNKAMGVTNKRAQAIQQRFLKMNRNIAAGYQGLTAGASKAFALIGGAAGFRALSDSGTRVTNSLKVAGLAGEELEGVYQKLLRSAQDNAAPLEALVELYGRVALVQGELGISSNQLTGFANNIAVALRASGKSSTEASGALLQLSQALGAGIVRSEEFTSIQEGAPTILQAAAAGIKEAGGSVAKLRSLMLDGQLSSRAFFDGINAGAPVLKEKLAGSVLTIDQRLENLRTSLVDATRRFNDSSQAAQTFGREIDSMSRFISQVDFDALISGLRSVSAEFQNATVAANAWLNKVGGETLGFDGIGRDIMNMIVPGEGAIRGFDIPGLPGTAFSITSTAMVTDRINQAFEEQFQKAGDLTAEAIRNSVLGNGRTTRLEKQLPAFGPVPAVRPEQVKPISLADPQYRASATGSSSGAGGKGRGGGSRGNDFEREIEQIKQRTAALQAETTAQAAVNPFVNDYGYAMEQARAKQELLTAAQQAGIKVTPQLSAQVDALASAYASSAAASERLADKQDEIRRRAEDAMSTAKDVTRGIIDGFIEGEKAADIFVNALKRIADALLNDVMDAIFQVGGAAGGTFGGTLFNMGFCK